MKGFIRQFGLRVKIPKDKLLKINDQVWDKVRKESISSSTTAIDIIEIELMRKQFAKKIESGEITTVKQITDILQKVAKK